LSDRELQGVVYTGTPGIGKSHLCAFVVAQELIAGKVVFFETVSSSIEQTHRVQFYRLDLARGAYSLASLQGLQFLGPDGNAVYIVDGGPASSTSPYTET
jgi:predicted ATP-dependent serine protease